MNCFRYIYTVNHKWKCDRRKKTKNDILPRRFFSFVSNSFSPLLSTCLIMDHSVSNSFSSALTLRKKSTIRAITGCHLKILVNIRRYQIEPIAFLSCVGAFRAIHRFVTNSQLFFWWFEFPSSFSFHFPTWLSHNIVHNILLPFYIQHPY